MEHINCKLRVVAHDYQAIDDIQIFDFYPNCAVEDYGGTRDLGLKILTQFLKEAQNEVNKSNGSITIGRGTIRKKERIKLYVKFADSSSGNDTEIDETNYEGLSEEERNKVNEENKKASKELSHFRIGGVVGALSGTVAVSVESRTVAGKKATFECYVNLEIRSRMDSDNGYYFISTLLHYTDIDATNSVVFSNSDDMFDFLLVDEFYHVLKNAMPKGYYKAYRRFNNNDIHLRGTIDFSRHIKENIGIKSGKIAYSYRENTCDNSFNQLLLLAYDKLRSRFPDIVNEKISKDIAARDYLTCLRSMITPCSRVTFKLLSENSRPIAHPYYGEYEEVRKISLRILRDEGLSVFDASDGSICGFLYYLPDLWECFLLEIIQNSLTDASVKEQDSKGFVQRLNQKGYSCLARPDFVFRNKAHQAFLILDAKFRIQWERAFGGNSLAKYCGEDINKCIRDMVVFDTKGTGVIFPYKRRNMEECGVPMKSSYFKRRISAESSLYFYVLPLWIPEYSDGCVYTDWNNQFEDCIKEFIKNLICIIEECKYIKESRE